MKCRECEYYFSSTCRRYPAYVVRGEGDWCGEWVAKYVAPVYQCLCGEVFKSDHALKVHCGKMTWGKHATA